MEVEYINIRADYLLFRTTCRPRQDVKGVVSDDGSKQ